MRRVVFGHLVGALVCALAIRLAMEVAKIAAGMQMRGRA
jgi:uncharacterized membrane protein